MFSARTVTGSSAVSRSRTDESGTVFISWMPSRLERIAARSPSSARRGGWLSFQAGLLPLRSLNCRDGLLAGLVPRDSAWEIPLNAPSAQHQRRSADRSHCCLISKSRHPFKRRVLILIALRRFGTLGAKRWQRVRTGFSRMWCDGWRGRPAISAAQRFCFRGLVLQRLFDTRQVQLPCVRTLDPHQIVAPRRGLEEASPPKGQDGTAARRFSSEKSR